MVTDGTFQVQRSSELSVQQLHTFRHVYEQSGYAAAARESNLSVPTVWQHIQSLEKLYGVRLFEKVADVACVQLRPRRNWYETLDQILVGLESTFDIVNSDTAKTDEITLVTGVRMMLEDLAEPLSRFREEFPNRLSIRHGNNRRAEELIVSGEADLALTLEAGFEKESPMIHYEPAYFVDFLAVASKDHPFSAAKSSGLRELIKHDLIVTAPGTHGRDALEQALHRERLQANIAIETDNSGFTIAVCTSWNGFGDCRRPSRR